MQPDQSAAPLFSIVTPAFRAQRWIPELLASLAAQSCGDYELVIAPDDGLDYTQFSTDPRVRVLARTAVASGESRARNEAVAASRGAYIAMLDADDLLAPDYLEAFRAHFAATGDAAAITPTEVFGADGWVKLCGGGKPTMDMQDLAWALGSVHVVCRREVHRAWAEDCVFGQDILRDASILSAAGSLAVVDTRYRLRLHDRQMTARVGDESQVRAEYRRLRELPVPPDVAELFAIRESANRFYERFRRPGEHWYRFFGRMEAAGVVVQEQLGSASHAPRAAEARESRPLAETSGRSLPMTALLDPRLANCRRLFLREVLMDANIGIHAAERAAAQRLVLNVDVFVPLAVSTPRHDKIGEVVDYDFVRATILRRIAQGHINLQETLVDDIARALLVHPGVAAVRVASEKPDVYEDAEAVGVEVFRFKDAAC
jgi:dihydroneopterin aldolase